MDRFNLYAQYYDLLYKDKNYTAEAAYVSSLILSHKKEAKTLLNLGCGTGKHDIEFARLGYDVTGADLSEEMIAIAIKNIPARLGGKLRFIEGDMRSLSIGRSFDAAISLFHVMGYQTANDDITAVMDTVHKHLNTGGLFIFDCWYGPGVLTDPPVVKVKHMADDRIEVIRTAKPELHSDLNVVDVNFTVSIKQRGETETTEIKESHKMRYLFIPEIELFIKGKFRMIEVFEWMSAKMPTEASWNAVFILQKI